METVMFHSPEGKDILVNAAIVAALQETGDAKGNILHLVSGEEEYDKILVRENAKETMRLIAAVPE